VRLLALLGGLLAHVAPAAAAVLPFAADTWRELERSPSRPMVVVFSTTDCTHCPKVIDRLAEDIRKAGSGARLVVVVMDGAGQEQELARDPHYRKARALYAFDGDAQALRYAVNPDWRGLTPYVAIIPAGGATRFHTGAPPPDAVRAFLRP
jgi:hypothetical protein